MVMTYFIKDLLETSQSGSSTAVQVITEIARFRKIHLFRCTKKRSPRLLLTSNVLGFLHETEPQGKTFNIL